MSNNYKRLTFRLRKENSSPMSKLQDFTTKLRRLRFSFSQIFFEEQEKPKQINSLAAKILKSEKELKKIRPYLNKLKYALLSEDVTNIAITGTYGSGKSTVLKTFQHINKQEDPNNPFEYLNISLASFKDEIIEDESISKQDASHNLEKLKSNKAKQTNKVHDPQNRENFERLLEVSILQQMIYHVKPSKIPDSRFKRIINLTNTELTITAIFFVIWLISTFSIWQFNIFEKINPSSWTYSLQDLDISSILLIIIFLLGLIVLTVKLIRTFGNSRISKITIKGELELGEKVDKSILNQHLDEIIYFFQRTGFNVVVIEDLDRFQNTEIFTKLREINLLLNNSQLVKRKIVFVYAIRDDMFQGHERIKFFDYIIPIIPFINPSNANDKLTELLKEEGLVDIFSPEFIDDVITFIDDIDMRLLTNILQEFLVYKESFEHELEYDNLLAIVIYKNIHPKDFSKLHKNKGDLFDFIKNKGNYIKDLIKELDDDITTNRSEILDCEKEKSKNETELKNIYLFYLLKQLDNPAEVTIGKETVIISELSDEENFEALLKEPKIRYTSYSIANNYGNNIFHKTKRILEKSFNDIEKEVNKEFTFNERLEIIENINDNRIEELRMNFWKVKN